MHLINFIIVLVFSLVAIGLFIRGLVLAFQKKESARGFISSGFMVGLLGVIIAVITFGFFNI
jgi:hypothetical protein